MPVHKEGNDFLGLQITFAAEPQNKQVTGSLDSYLTGNSKYALPYKTTSKKIFFMLFSHNF